VARAFVGLGSNLGDREGSIRAALEELDRTQGVRTLAVSRLRETAPVGYVDQPDFLNAVAEVETTLPAKGLLDALLAVERKLGRTRHGPRYGPRTIDLDLLLYDDAKLEERGLAVPHPRLHERLFVLEPLHELDPALVVPGHGPLETLLRKLQSG
jgi:2-amino-4-hydroxy-6-hydroxymethyldihydropteridine diphosphokinase